MIRVSALVCSILFWVAPVTAHPSHTHGLLSLQQAFELTDSQLRELHSDSDLLSRLPPGYSLAEILNRQPQWPNPFLSFLPPDADPDMGYWHGRSEIESRLAVGYEAPRRSTVEIDETEPNDSQGSANPLPGVGTGSEEDPEAIVSGSISGNDADFFSLDLELGDVVGLAVSGAAQRVELFDPSGVERLGSSQNRSFSYPPTSGLPRNGAAVGAYVAEEAGAWTVAVTGGSGSYTLVARLFRRAGCQKIFVDFDGPTVDPSVWGGPSGNVALSPLVDFLADWGLSPADENPLIDGILAVVEENLRLDLLAAGVNPLFDLQILNSRDHPGSFGAPGVSRIIAGGTVAEIGFNAVGIAQSIDPGNFAAEEDAVVLLDMLSAPGGFLTLNQFDVMAPATKVDLVAQGVGNILAHEAAHYLGNFHTDPFSATPSLSDSGNNFQVFVGVGADGILGTADDVDVDLMVDTYNPPENFSGIEDSLSTIALTITDPMELFSDGFESGNTTAWSSSLPELGRGCCSLQGSNPIAFRQGELAHPLAGGGE